MPWSSWGGFWYCVQHGLVVSDPRPSLYEPWPCPRCGHWIDDGQEWVRAHHRGDERLWQRAVEEEQRWLASLGQRYPTLDGEAP